MWHGGLWGEQHCLPIMSPTVLWGTTISGPEECRGGGLVLEILHRESGVDVVVGASSPYRNFRGWWREGLSLRGGQRLYPRQQHCRPGYTDD